MNLRTSLPRVLRQVKHPITPASPTARSISTTPWPSQSTPVIRFSSPSLHQHFRQASSIQRAMHFTSKLSAASTSTSEGSDGSEPPAARSMSQDEYNAISDQDMDLLHENLEILCEQYGPSDWEVDYSSGVMTLILPPHGTYVINKQPPNQQIWMSSPLSGPSRFSYVGESWAHHRKSDVTLGKLLQGELEELSRRSGVDAADWEGVGLP